MVFVSSPFTQTSKPKTVIALEEGSREEVDHLLRQTVNLVQHYEAVDHLILRGPYSARMHNVI